jgi:dTDP-4-amino-4,6-dideoxygalactose transaminase
MNVHEVTRAFEAELCRYTGAPHAVALDNCTSALFLALMREGVAGKTISIPARTYMSVPCVIIQAGGQVRFLPVDGRTITGQYRLEGTRVIDSALSFTAGMYIPGTFMCLSFTGPYKHLKLGKGGAILTDDPDADAWFRRARFSGRREMSYHDDTFDMLGWNFWMPPQIAALGLHLMPQFWHLDGTPKHNEDLTLPYPDLSRFPVYSA